MKDEQLILVETEDGPVYISNKIIRSVRQALLTELEEGVLIKNIQVLSNGKVGIELDGADISESVVILNGKKYESLITH